MKFLHQISQKWYFRLSTSFYPDRSDIEPNEPWRAHVPMGLYQTPVSNRESIFSLVQVSGAWVDCLRNPVLKASRENFFFLVKSFQFRLCFLCISLFLQL